MTRPAFGAVADPYNDIAFCFDKIRPMGLIFDEAKAWRDEIIERRHRLRQAQIEAMRR